MSGGPRLGHRVRPAGTAVTTINDAQMAEHVCELIRELVRETVCAKEECERLAAAARRAAVTAVPELLRRSPDVPVRLGRSHNDSELRTGNDPAQSEPPNEAGPAKVGDGLASYRAARDRAVADLVTLRRRIRSVVIGALIDRELGGDYQRAAARVERFLIGLGLDGLPRTRRVRTVAGLDLLVRAETAELARCFAAQPMRWETSPGEIPLLVDCGWFADHPVKVEPGVWLVRWRKVYNVWLSGYPAEKAVVAARATVETEVSRVVAGLEVKAVDIACTDEGLHIDEALNPAID